MPHQQIPSVRRGLGRFFLWKLFSGSLFLCLCTCSFIFIIIIIIIIIITIIINIIL